MNSHTIRHRTIAFLLGVLCYLPISARVPAAEAIEIESHEYLETIGEAQQVIQWCVEKTDNTRMLWKNKNEFSVIQSSGRYDSVMWKGINLSEETSISALRKGDTIIIEGKLKGVPIDKTVTIDAVPWYQSMSWSLRNLVLSGNEKLVFWTLRPDTFKEHKMVARKTGEEEIQINGTTHSTVKLEVRLKGLLSPFWHSTYWYRKDDAVWLRYEGPSGPPGNPMIVIEYRHTNDRCNIEPVPMSANQGFHGSHNAHGQAGE